MVHLYLAGVSIVLFSPLLFYHRSHTRQLQHVNTIRSTNQLNALSSDYYTDKPLHNSALCPYLRDVVGNGTSPPYHFSDIELVKLDTLYMSLVYNKRNFPYTFRNNVYVDIDNDTANEIFRYVCREYYSADPSPNAGYYIGAFMLALFVCNNPLILYLNNT
jgi:hypothetical protein